MCVKDIPDLRVIILFAGATDSSDKVSKINNEVNHTAENSCPWVKHFHQRVSECQKQGGRCVLQARYIVILPCYCACDACVLYMFAILLYSRSKTASLKLMQMWLSLVPKECLHI